MPSHRLPPLTVRLAAAIACAVALTLPVTAPGAQTLADGPGYTGDVRLDIAIPGERRQVQQGTATLRLVPRGDSRADFVIEGGMTDNASRADLTVKGSYREGGWYSDPGDLPLTIHPDGRIAGGGHDTVKQLRFQLSGSASAHRLRLRNEVTVDSAQGGAPAGTVLTYTYDVQRAQPRAPARAADPDATGCQMRMVAIPTFGGGMSMGMVPDCDPE